MAAGPRVTVVVPTRDRPEALARCLAALERQTVDDFEVVVVDDRSRSTEAVRAVVQRAPRARIVMGEGRGPAAARNLGVVSSDGELVCFTDDDCRPGDGWLATFVQRFDDGAAVVAGPTLGDGDVVVRASQLVTNHLVDESRDASGAVGFAPTSNIACRRAVHEAAPFDETFPTAAGEDRAWCDRLHASGHRIEFDAEAWVLHEPALTVRGLWRQYARYGAGAYRYLSALPSATRRPSAGFYARLLRRAFAEGVVTGLLVVMTQVATAVGLAREAYRARGGS